MLDTTGNKDEHISDIFLWIPTDGRKSLSRPAKTYIY